MDSVLALRPLPSCFAPSRNPRFSSFAANRRIKIQTFASKFPKTPRIPLSIPHNTRLFSLLEASRSVGSGEEERPALSAERIVRQVVLGLFCFVFGFTQFRVGRGVAVAAPLVSEAVLDKEEVNYEYSEYTKRLLETVGVLLKSVDEVRGGNGDVKLVEAAWKAVRGKKDELQDEILGRLHGELRELRKEKEGLVKRSDEVVAEVVKVKRELEKLAGNAGEEKAEEMEERMEERLGSLEEEYNGIWEKVGEIEDRILRRETGALSYGVRELCFIERECEQLVQSFTRQMRRKNVESVPKDSVTKLSKSDIQKDLENAQRNNLEQMILPNVVEVDDPGPLFNSTDFAKRIKQGLKDSRELQKKTEAEIRKNMKKFGSEKRFLVKTPEDEVVKGFPEVELKWMFGDKEVVVPKAAGLHLFHGWKKWREDAKADLKRNLLEDVDFGKQYVAQRQELILLDRDRVVSKTWYNEEKNRWEMDPVAVPFSVSKKLVEHARIRHDWGAMYIALKGDDKEYYVDIKEFEMLFEDFGGFDGLYMKMLACGIPTAVHLMWIPLSELDIHQRFLLPIKLDLNP